LSFSTRSAIVGRVAGGLKLASRSLKSVIAKAGETDTWIRIRTGCTGLHALNYTFSVLGVETVLTYLTLNLMIAGNTVQWTGNAGPIHKFQTISATSTFSDISRIAC